jgi:hypothetical protein
MKNISQHCELRLTIELTFYNSMRQQITQPQNITFHDWHYFVADDFEAYGSHTFFGGWLFAVKQSKLNEINMDGFRASVRDYSPVCVCVRVCVYVWHHIVFRTPSTAPLQCTLKKE